MQYILLIYQNERWPQLSVNDKNQVHVQCGAWHEALVRRGQSRGAIGLQPVGTAKTLRSHQGETAMTDGPFAETKEVLGGLEIVECRDLAEALAIARDFPALQSGCCTVEVRPGVPGGECRD